MIIGLVLALGGCSRAPSDSAASVTPQDTSAPVPIVGAPPPPQLGPPTSAPRSPRPAGLPTATSANIAELNLDFTITQGRNFLQQQPKAADAARGLIASLLLRARNRNTFEDFDDALNVAEKMTRANPGAPDSWLGLASVQVALHRFDAAIASVDRAAGLGAQHADTAAQRGSIAIARGNSLSVLPALAQAARARPDYSTHSAHAIALQELGRTEEADAAYAAALAAYDDVSAYAIAWVFFQRGVLWTDADPAKARQFYEYALTYLPDHITTNVHLAELEHAAGDTAKALARMQRIVARSKDPEPMGLLATLLIASGRTAEATPWINRARAGYDALLTRHRLAFVDHAAEFYTGVGDDGARALQLAEENLTNRHTLRAYRIAMAAAEAANSHARACTIARDARALGHPLAADACAV